MLNIDEPRHYRVALHHLGFRPFFLLAGVAATLLMALWAGLYLRPASMPVNMPLPATFWHAHEMIFGYALAVIAGFLLTAVRNWTGVQTLHGWPLLVLALLWLLARILPLLPLAAAMELAAVFDLTFGLALAVALFIPIARVRQWKQLFILLIVLLLVAANTLFYFGTLGELDAGLHVGLYSGLYLVIALILFMGRRVIPFFIEKGVAEDVQAVNYAWLDISIPLVLLTFIVVEVLVPLPVVAAALALLLAILNGIRLYGWHTPGIWQRPLLWILFVAYAWIIAGFALRALSEVAPVNPSLAVHALTVGGIGLMTLGMMARVALGHTGRNVFEPPAVLGWIFALAVAASIVRVMPPLFTSAFYPWWIGISQLLWIAAFALFTWIYAPMLVKPRVDGRYG